MNKKLMTTLNSCLLAILAALLLSYVIFRILKDSRPAINTLKSVIFSTACMIGLNYIGIYIGIFTPLNAINLFVAGILGAPGICIMTILNTIF